MNPDHWPAFEQARWYAGKGRDGQCVGWRPLGWWGASPVLDGPGLAPDSPAVVVRSEVATIAYPDGGVEHYQIPVSYRRERLAQADLGIIDPVLGHAHDAVADPEALAQILAALGGSTSAADASWSTTCRRPWRSPAPVRAFQGEQSNTNVLVGTEALVKFYRRLEPGNNPDIEVLGALTPADDVAELYSFATAHVPPAAASLATPAELPAIHTDLAMVVEQFPDAVSGWDLALESTQFNEPAHSLGAALARVHAALAASFGTGPLSGEVVADQMLARLRAAESSAPTLAGHHCALAGIFGRLSGRDLVAQRVHGDFHLGQALMTADGWRIIDFEGEPMKTVAERTARDEPVRDVAGLVRSLDYAQHSRSGTDRRWHDEAVTAFLQGYRTAVATPGVLSGYGADTLAAYEADRAVYELVYETRNRPDLVDIPMTAIARLTQGAHP